MPRWPVFYDTNYEMRTRTPDGRILTFLSGYVGYNFRGSGGAWLRDDGYVAVGPVWSRLDGVVPVVTPTAIANDGEAINAGWAVDNCRWSTFGGRILLMFQMAVRDSDGYLIRVAYQVTAMGLL